MENKYVLKICIEFQDKKSTVIESLIDANMIRKLYRIYTLNPTVLHQVKSLYEIHSDDEF